MSGCNFGIFMECHMTAGYYRRKSTMFNFRQTTILVLIALLLCPSEALARGGRGGGGGRSMGGGGMSSMSRSSPAMSRSPSMSRPSMPSYGGGGAARPSMGAVSGRPSGGARPGSPGPVGGARPGAGGVAARPGVGAGTRPGTGLAAGGRPSAGQLQNFLNLPSQGGRLAADAGAGLAGSRLPAGGNAAVADFFQGTAARTTSAGSVAGERADRIGQRTDTRSDFRDSRGENRDFASDNRQGRVEGRGDRQAARVDNRGDYRSNLADGRGDRRTERQQQLGDHADNIRNEMSDRFDENHLFEDFWRDHPQAYVNFHQNPVFWSWATFGAVSAFMPWNWGSAAYYDYGSGGSSYSDPGTEYVNESTYSSPEYVEQAEQLATSAPEEAPKDAEWMPLGVFAATADNNPDAVPNMFMQLAISKEGIIAGTYQNKTTGKSESLEGMVDKDSQRAAWTFSGKNTPIFETGVANLTMNETRALVHFADGTTQPWLLVRMAKPDSTAGQTLP